MKKFILTVLFLILCLPAYSVEIEQQEALQTIHHVIPIKDDEQTIETLNENYDDFQFPNEVELKGTVIYNEGAKIQEIELDKTVEKPAINLKTPHMVIPVKHENLTIYDKYLNERSALSTATRITGEEYIIAPVWTKITEQVGNFSYGTIYTSGLDYSQLQTTMNIYTRYDFKHFAIMGAVGTNERNTYMNKDEQTIQIAPEIKLTKSFVIRDTVQAYVNETYKKNKISIIYTPQIKNHEDLLRFELGFSQTYFGGGKSKSAIEFSTKIRL